MHNYVHNFCTAEISQYGFAPMTYSLNNTQSSEILDLCHNVQNRQAKNQLDNDIKSYAAANSTILEQIAHKNFNNR